MKKLKTFQDFITESIDINSILKILRKDFPDYSIAYTDFGHGSYSFHENDRQIVEFSLDEIKLDFKEDKKVVGKIPKKGNYLVINHIFVEPKWRRNKLYTNIIESLSKSNSHSGIASLQYSDNAQERSEMANKFWESLLKRKKVSKIVSDPWEEGLETTYIYSK